MGLAGKPLDMGPSRDEGTMTRWLGVWPDRWEAAWGWSGWPSGPTFFLACIAALELEQVVSEI